MRIERDIINLLLRTEAITNIVSDRIYPLRLHHKSALPAITIMRIKSAITDRSRFGGMNSPQLQITAWGNEFTQISELSEAIEEALDGVSLHLESGHVTIFKINDRSLFDPDVKLMKQPIDIEVHHEKH